jgi:hypothetical protein
MRLALPDGVTPSVSVNGGPYQGLGGGNSNDWYGRMSTFLFAKIPQLNTAIPVKMGASPNSAASATWADGFTEGGSINGGATGWAKASVATVYQTPKTGKVGVGFRARMAATPPSAQGALGIVNTANSHHVTVQTINTDTHYILRITGGATTQFITAVLADHLFHDWAFTLDGTTFSVYMDSIALGAAAVPIGTLTDFTNVIDVGMAPGWLDAGGASHTDVSDCLYAYIAP